MLLAEEPPEPDIPPPNASTAPKPQVDSWLFTTVAVAVVLMFLAVYKAVSSSRVNLNTSRYF
jgi:hypothetical protein